MGTLILLVSVQILILFLLLKQRERISLNGREGAAIAAYTLLALLQGLLQNQVQFDDLLFTPIYLAIPVWLGVSGGPNQGAVGSALSFLALSAVSAVVPAESGLEVGYGLPFVHIFLAAVVLMLIGALAGVLRFRPLYAPFSVLLWVVFIASVQTNLLLSAATWLAIILGATVASAGLIVRSHPLLGRTLAWVSHPASKENAP